MKILFQTEAGMSRAKDSYVKAEVRLDNITDVYKSVSAFNALRLHIGVNGVMYGGN